MNKKHTVRISTIFAVITASLLSYYLLLHENFLHTSIGEIIDYSHTLEITEHVLILGILPIYIAIMVFGAVMSGLYLGKSLNRFMLRRFERN